MKDTSIIWRRTFPECEPGTDGVALAVGLYIVGNYSELRQELVCAGHWKDAPTENETTYVQLNEYRWWVRLWSNTRGDATVQTDKRGLSVRHREALLVVEPDLSGC